MLKTLMLIIQVVALLRGDEICKDKLKSQRYLVAYQNGRDGRDGKDGQDGRNGVDGVNGKNGYNGKDGRDGVNGLNGEDCTKSTKRNWRECAWNNIDDGKDYGLIKDCDFDKASNTTYMKVSVTTNMRIYNLMNKCKRWFVTFDGKECLPVPIDGIVYTDSKEDLHRTRSFTGHCKIRKSGLINVGLNVGDCASYTGGDAMTGWKSSTRIYIEEIESPQREI